MPFQKGIKEKTKCFLFTCVIKFMKHLLSLAWKLVLKQGDIAPIINMADKQCYKQIVSFILWKNMPS